MTDFLQRMRELAPDCCVRADIPLKPCTTMRVGGNAEFFSEPGSPEEVSALIRAAHDTDTPVLLLGNASNVLVRDGGVPGLVIRLGEHFSNVSVDDHRIVAQAGALLSTISRIAQQHSLTGLEFASGIPGSVGGAVYMNAGAYGGEMAQVVQSVQVLEDGKITTYQNDQMDFSYRHSRLTGHGGVVLSVCFELSAGNGGEISARMNEWNARRREKQPLQYPSCGSFFKRPQGYFAGALIEQAGLKGVRVGGAQVSEKHAGFIVNTGDATAQDVINLMHLVQARVMEQFHVSLEPEVQIVGRDT